MATPIVLSYFSQGNPYLKNIIKEVNCLQNTWKDFNTRIEVEYFPQVDPEVNDIIDHIRNYKHKMIIFHFSGHAANQNLFFENESANANGIAGLLGEAQNLKMVFLNGCATSDQVNLLLENNVKVVIATKGRIEDGLAMKFSDLFYKNITIGNGNTIEESFSDTINSLIASNSLPIDTYKTASIISRGLETENQEDQNRWELFVKKGFENEINKTGWWKLKLVDSSKKDSATVDDKLDLIIKILIVLFAVTGLFVFIFFAIQKNFQFSMSGGFFTFLSLFGYKNLKKYKTIEVNSEYVDSELLKKINLNYGR